MDQGACGSRHERSAPLEQDARHDDLQEVQRRKITVDAACSVDGPGDEQQIDGNLGVGLGNVGLVEFEKCEPASRQPVDGGQQHQHVCRRFAYGFSGDEDREGPHPDIDQP